MLRFNVRLCDPLSLDKNVAILRVSFIWQVHQIIIGSIENHRAREKGTLVYPVYSRRSQGLSMGINLFPDHKQCSFNCPYCEVFPFKTDSMFSLEGM